MSEPVKHIIGVLIEFVAEATGVPSSFHSITGLSFDYTYRHYTVTLGSWYNKTTFENGRSPVGSIQLQLSEAPPRNVDVIDWVLQQIVSQQGDDNRFSGAELVYAE
ncbi:hypothetical protein FKR43_03395 [Neisseria meningitidis]|nr:hypothetical protein [Neisseria meningitidis]